MYRLKFIVYILVALVLCNFLFVFTLYRYAVPRFENSLVELERQKMDFIIKQFALKANEAEYIASASLMDGDVKWLMLGGSPQTTFERTTMIRGIRDRLEASVISTTGLEAIYIYRYADGYWVSYPSIGNFTSVRHFYKTELLKSFEIGQGWISDSENTLYYYVTYPYNDKFGKSVEYVSTVEIQKSYLDDLLESALNSEYSGVLMVLPSTDSYLQKGINPDGLVEQLLSDSNVAGKSGKNQITFANKSYLVFSHYSETYGTCFVTYYDRTLLITPIRVITIVTAAFMVIILIMAVMHQLLFYQNILKQIYVLMANLKRVEKGDFEAKIETTPKNEFKYLFEQFNIMTSGIKKLINSLDTEYKQRVIAENKHIQAQISPHFLYNSLFFIVSVAGKPDAVEKMATHLAEYYRYKTRTKELVLLMDEIRFAENYLTIISLRKNIHFEINVSQKLANVEILPLLIQPLLENAVVHGIEGKEGANRVILTVAEEKDGFTVEVIDDGEGMSEEKIELLCRMLSEDSSWENVGLLNVNKRLLSYYGKISQLRLGQDEILSGLKIGFYIPFRK